jgi:hypothetical protein
MKQQVVKGHGDLAIRQVRLLVSAIHHVPQNAELYKNKDQVKNLVWKQPYF